MFKITRISPVENDETCYKNYVTLSKNLKDITDTYRVYLFGPHFHCMS